MASEHTVCVHTHVDERKHKKFTAESENHWSPFIGPLPFG
jgi:hypothetical protein